MPTSAQNTFSANRIVPFWPKPDAVRENFALPASTTLVAGTMVGELADTPGTVDAYSTGGSNGLSLCRGVLEYDCATDSAGNITFGTVAGANAFGVTALVAPVFVAGAFATGDLTGLDDNGVEDLNGHLASGDVSDGVLIF